MTELGGGDFVAGMAMLAAVLGAAAFAGHVAVRRLAPALAGVPAAMAWALLATTMLLVEHGLPLTLGVLSRGTVLVTAAVVVVVALVARRRGGLRAAEEAVPAGRDGRVVRWVGIAAAALAAGGAAAYLRAHAAEPPVSIDTLSFQLPQVVRWMQTGSLWQLDQFFPDYSNATYPSHGNLLLLVVMLPFDAAFLARLVAVPFGVLTCAAVYACARELGAARGWALTAAALPAASPVFIRAGLTGANTDLPMTFFIAAGALFLLRHHRTRARSDLLLAGLGAGLAVGTKWYALTVLPAVLAVWLVAEWRGRVPWRRLAGSAARLAAVALAAGGLWLVRNWVEAGNPLFPQPLGPFNAPRDVYREIAGFSLVDYATDPAVWSTYLRPQFDRLLAAPGYVLAAAPLLALALAGRRRSGRAATVAVAALAALAAYSLTPYSALGPEGMPTAAASSMRYALPALLLGAVALAWAGTRLPGAAGGALAALLGLAALQGLRTEYRPDVSVREIAAAALAVAGAAWLASRARRAAPVVAAAAVLAVAGAVLVYDGARGRGYGSHDPTLAWLEANAPSGHRVGLAGDWSVEGVAPPLPAFGPRFGNEVAYVGPFRRHMLRHERDPRRFADRLRAGGFDVLIVGRGLRVTGRPAPEERWARAAGFEPVVASPRLALLVRR